MPGLEPLTGTFVLPWWTLIAVAILIAILGALAGMRAGWQKAIGSVTQLVAVFGVLLLTWVVFDRLSARDAAEQRRSFQTRLAELNGHSLAPASPLSCLDGLAGDAFDEPCEKAIFASPESAAAAVSLMAGRMSLLREAVTLGASGDGYYEPVIAELRRSLEPDRFGFVAQALATGEQCKPDACEALSLLKDARRVNANLGDRTFETYVGRYVAEWLTRQGAPAVASNPAPKQAAAPGATATPSEHAKVAPVASSVTVDFPSAASIPPVSIMNNEPGVTGQGGTDVEPKAAASRKPARQHQRRRRARPPAVQPHRLPQPRNSVRRTLENSTGICNRLRMESVRRGATISVQPGTSCSHPF